MDDDPLWMPSADLRREVVRLRALRDALLAHATSPAVPHSPAWDDQLEAIYQAAEDTR
jgi:hypothetical protein